MTEVLVFQILVILAGILVCVGGGLLALLPDTDQPVAFIPVYFLTLLFFASGLVLICWFQSLGETMAGWV